MDAIEMLKAEHKGAKGVMEQIVKGPTSKVKALFNTLCKELEAHDRVEEQIFYPAVKANPKSSAFQGLDKTAHLEIEAALERLKGLSVESREWMPEFKAMQTKLLKHVADEEGGYFVTIRTFMNTAELNQLGEKMKSGKKELVKAA